ncbi:MAG: hypothetical protein H0T97_07680 [Actinobacteria bacterium]|nr:hypothetical protein [Actinomycetota bacterium]
MTRSFRIAALVATLAAALVVAAPAGSANECEGLQVCVPIVGPWVSVPAAGGAARPEVRWQLTCPRSFIVGGLDARLTERAIDVSFVGLLGSPVNPGITTSRSVTFVATHVGRSSGAPSFKPYIGCMPARGGGSRVPTSVSVFPPGQPATLRSKTVRVRPGAATVNLGCRPGERLVGASHAFGFFTRTPPSASLVSSVSGTRAVRGGKVVVVSLRGDAEVGGVRAVVQVQALCSRSR